MTRPRPSRLLAVMFTLALLVGAVFAAAVSSGRCNGPGCRAPQEDACPTSPNCRTVEPQENACGQPGGCRSEADQLVAQNNDRCGSPGGCLR
jgi:hypothetical protein